MRSTKTRSGVTIFIIKENEFPPDNEIVFFEGEWEWAQTIAKGYASDPELIENFWKTVLEKKQSDKNYNFFTDFPKIKLEANPHPNELAKRYCDEILEMLKGRKQEDVEKKV